VSCQHVSDACAVPPYVASAAVIVSGAVTSSCIDVHFLCV